LDRYETNYRPAAEDHRIVREVQNGNTFFSHPITKRHHSRDQESIDRGGQFKKRSNRLSSREAEVLQLIAEGKPNKQLAAELGVTFKTVNKHRQHLMTKLNIHDDAGPTRYAIGAGIENSVQATIV
jgi:DNA-binding NarL/FixJ family response regulator